MDDLWELTNEVGEDLLREHDEYVLEIMDENGFFRNAKSAAKTAINKFWSLPEEERIDLMYDYFTIDEERWVALLKGVEE